MPFSLKAALSRLRPRGARGSDEDATDFSVESPPGGAGPEEWDGVGKAPEAPRNKAEGEASSAAEPVAIIRRAYEVKWRDVGRLESILANDAVSRQSFTWRRAAWANLERDTVFFFIEGREDVLEAADIHISRFARPAANAAALWRALEAEGERSAEALGALAARAKEDEPPPPPPPEPRNGAEALWWRIRREVLLTWQDFSDLAWRARVRMRRKKY